MAPLRLYLCLGHSISVAGYTEWDHDITTRDPERRERKKTTNTNKYTRYMFMLFHSCSQPPYVDPCYGSSVYLTSLDEM